MSEAASFPARHLLVLGGARSGKSAYAQRLAEASGLDLNYCATATDYDDPEMRERIARHKAERDARWRTLDAPLALRDLLMRESQPDRLILVDCLTLWLTNILLGEYPVADECEKLAAALPALPGPVIFVSNEVGTGIVPENALARRFRDAQGRLNQTMAAACDTVILVAAGLPVRLKPSPEPNIRFARG